MEDTEMKQLIPKSSRSRRSLDAHRYTSLSDVLLVHRYRPTFRSAIVGRGRHASMSSVREFDTSAIRIRNRLVKHAASAYLQTAATTAAVANRDQNCVARLWRRLRHRRSSWNACMRDPFEQCIGFVARSVSHALARVVGHLGRVCAWGRSSMI